MMRPRPRSTLFPYTTLFRSQWEAARHALGLPDLFGVFGLLGLNTLYYGGGIDGIGVTSGTPRVYLVFYGSRSEEHTSELQSPDHLVCRLLLEKKNNLA